MNIYVGNVKYEMTGEVGSQPCRSVSQGVGLASCLPKTAWPPTCYLKVSESYGQKVT